MTWQEIATLLGAMGSLVSVLGFGAHQIYRYGQLVEGQRDQGRQIEALVEQSQWLRKEIGNLKVSSVPRSECYMQMRDAQQDVLSRLDRLEDFMRAAQPGGVQ